MKLLYELPDEVDCLIKQIIKTRPVLYCVPADLDYSGTYIDGWLVITSFHMVYVVNGRLIEQISISEGKDYKSSVMVGNGMLEGTINGSAKLIVRYTMEHAERYTHIAAALNQLSVAKEPAVKSLEYDNRCPECNRMYPAGTRACPACSGTLFVFKRLFSIVKPHGILLIAAIILFWAVTGIQLFIPYLYRRFIDDFLIPGRTDALLIVIYVGGIAACNLLIMFISIIRDRFMIKAGNRISRDLRHMVYEKIQMLSLSYLDNKKTGELMNRVTGDTERIRNFIQTQSVMTINQVFSLIGISIVLFLSNWRLAILILIPAPFVLFLSTSLRHRIRRMYHQQWRSMDKTNSLLRDILSGIRVVKAFGQEQKEVNRFKTASRELTDITIRNEKAWNTIFPSLGFIMGLGNFLLLYFGSNMVLDQQMKVGELIQFTQYAGMVYGPLNWMGFIPRWLAEAFTSTERVFQIIQEKIDIKDKNDAVISKINGRISFKNVTFGYRNYEPVLKDITIDINPGEMIGLVGRSGAGKSTLINLIMRLYDVDDGNLTIDGVDIKDMSQDDLRTQIGVVLQETFLFSGTILENIKYSKPAATFDDVIRAAKIANAHNFILNFPYGYDTKVGEKGLTLSGGERQRIAIARAILHDPRILILDEATASLDTETEQQIQEALGRLIEGRTTIAIAHRLSTLKNAGRLFVIEQGGLAESGTHEELLKKKGIYYDLIMAQRQMARLR